MKSKIIEQIINNRLIFSIQIYQKTKKQKFDAKEQRKWKQKAKQTNKKLESRHTKFPKEEKPKSKLKPNQNRASLLTSETITMKSSTEGRETASIPSSFFTDLTTLEPQPSQCKSIFKTTVVMPPPSFLSPPFPSFFFSPAFLFCFFCNNKNKQSK